MLRLLIVAILLCAGARAEDYCFGFLNAHPERRAIPEAEAEQIQKGHLAHMKKMGLDGHLLAAGPILTDGGPRGIVIYRCASLAEARQWTALDPAVQNKRLTLDVHRWRGPDGIGEPLMTQFKKDPEVKMNMIRIPLVVYKKTPKWSAEATSKLIPEHMKNAERLVEEGKLRAAGPWVTDDGNIPDDPETLGVFIFSSMPLEDALALARTDPFVRDGYVLPVAYTWMVAEGVMPPPKTAH